MHHDVTRAAARIEHNLSVRQHRRDPLGRAVLALLDKLACSADLGSIDLTMPAGARRTIGQPSSAAPSVRITRWRDLAKIARNGALGFADAYIDGHICVEDLGALFEYVLDNEAGLARLLPRLHEASREVLRYHKAHANTRSGSRRNVAAHYDLGNRFYEAWLDATMLYSSGIFRHPDDTLEMAQREKIARIFEALDLVRGQSVLEIGCGWGQLAAEAASRGAQVKAVTISEAQKRGAEERIAKAGLHEKVEISFEDYRDIQGVYDRVVSVEMIEAVGEENWPGYFAMLAERLKRDGIAVIQAITIDEGLFDHYRSNPDFIQRYIFPGGMLPSVQRMAESARLAGLRFETVETFGPSYARTLCEWRKRFEAAWPMISADQGFDERFRRMWLYYFIYCEVGFRRGFIDVGLYRLTRAER
ncbi:MAG: cyclopropane-fatty-acyl-phospholipid synthase family protein [Hyphomicrobiaceae bacterium]